MGRGGVKKNNNVDCEYSWEEIRQHSQDTDRWIVVDGQVYDVTRWAKRHPGGEKILQGFAGQDASAAWYAFHKHGDLVATYMKPLRVGRVQRETAGITNAQTQSPLMADFCVLRGLLEAMGCFTPSAMFFVAVMVHILLLEFLGWFVIYQFGTGWSPYIIATVLLTTSQAQAGWAQHDYGHLSVFKSTRLNHAVQLFTINFLKGISAAWWNYRHFNHHAKPNVVTKDPDMELVPWFLLGKVLPVEYAKKKKGFMPYNHQHQYFYLILPPLVLPLFFNLEILYYVISRKLWMELLWLSAFFVRWQLMFYPMLGFWGTFGLYLFVRFLESHWFVWTTQMNHLPMDIDYDQNDDWVTSQVRATCNVEGTAFNSWFTGHLNYQIEHHLFPTMARCNYYKVAPLVKSLCEKHGLDYQTKPLWTAMVDIHRVLRSSGQLWFESYNM